MAKKGVHVFLVVAAGLVLALGPAGCLGFVAGGGRAASRPVRLLPSSQQQLRSPCAVRPLRVDISSLCEAAATAAALSAAGDSVAQAIGAKGVGGSSSWDIRRSLGMALFGFSYTGIFQRVWFNWLSLNVASPVARLVLNQWVAIPFIYYPLFLLCIPLVRQWGDAAGQVRMRQQLLDGLPSTMALNWLFWVPAQSIMFAFIPEVHQVLFCAALGVGWNTLLSLKTMMSLSDALPAAVPIESDGVVDIQLRR